MYCFSFTANVIHIENLHVIDVTETNVTFESYGLWCPNYFDPNCPPADNINISILVIELPAGSVVQNKSIMPYYIHYFEITELTVDTTYLFQAYISYQGIVADNPTITVNAMTLNGKQTLNVKATVWTASFILRGGWISKHLIHLFLHPQRHLNSCDQAELQWTPRPPLVGDHL